MDERAALARIPARVDNFFFRSSLYASSWDLSCEAEAESDQASGRAQKGETHSTPVGTFGSETEALDLKTSAGSARAVGIELLIASLSADSAGDASGLQIDAYQ